MEQIWIEKQYCTFHTKKLSVAVETTLIFSWNSVLQYCSFASESGECLLTLKIFQNFESGIGINSKIQFGKQRCFNLLY